MLQNYPNTTTLHTQSLGDWYSWIPTNIGYLNFNYIADKENLDSVFGQNNYTLKPSPRTQKKIKIIKTYLSDSNPLINKILDKKEFYPTAYLEFNKTVEHNTILDKEKPQDITGSIVLSFGGVDPEHAHEENAISLHEVKEYKRISANFIIERTGKLHLKNVSYIIDPEMHEIDINDTKLTELTALYTLIKKVVHGDNHHFQKIDTMIGIYKTFEPKQILTDLGFHIKRLDKFLKNESNDIGMTLFLQDKEKIASYANGFKSYIDTFYNLYEHDLNNTPKEEKNYFISHKNISNTIKSIEAKSESLKIAKNYVHNIKMFCFTLLGFFISANILISSLTINYESKSFTWIQSWLERDYLVALLFLIILYFLRLDLLNLVIQVMRKKITKKENYNYLEYFIIYNYLMDDIKAKTTSKEYIDTYLAVTNYLTPKKNKVIYGAILLIGVGIFVLFKWGL